MACIPCRRRNFIDGKYISCPQCGKWFLKERALKTGIKCNCMRKENKETKESKPQK